MSDARPAASGQTTTIDFPEEFVAWLEYLELADPDAYELFQRQADVTLG